MLGNDAVTHSGFVAVAGRPNAGKSTLVNELVGQHVAIVSPVAQTTRRVVRAVLTEGPLQFVFIDLPGSQRPRDRLTERMQGAVERSVDDVDVVLWVIDATQSIGAGERAVADHVLRSGVPVVVAANKTDQLGKPELGKWLHDFGVLVGDRDYHGLVPVSALTGDGVGTLIDEVGALLPEGPAYYPPDEPTDMRDEERIAEYVREAMLTTLRDELPHATIVEVDEVRDEDDVLHVECTIWVESKSQVGIVVGKGGAGVKQAGTDARAVIERELGVRCFLGLRVKVREHWRNDDRALERWGL